MKFRAAYPLLCSLALSSVLCSLALSSVFAKPPQVEEIWGQYCASCHGDTFQGGLGGDLADGVWKHGASDEEIAKSIRNGLPTLGMVPYGGVLSEEQIRALVVFMREKERAAHLKQVEYPKPSPDTVAKTQREEYRIEIVTEDVKLPWGIAFLPDGRKLVTEIEGRLRVIDANGKLEPDAVKGTPAVIRHGQGGLMDVAAHPDYAENGWIYLAFSDGTRTKPEKGKDEVKALTAIVRGRIRDNEWVDQEWIYRADRKYYTGAGVHFGSRIVFRDGYLFFIVGERGGRMEVQDVTRPNGKIFRLFDDGRVPPDNPFSDRPDAEPGIWSYGHRNPQGLAFDSRNGDLYSTEHGPRGGDEFNLIRKGANYGWPVITHGINYDGRPIGEATEREGMEQPVLHWTPSIAPCGLAFYTGKKFPGWDGDFFAGSLRQEELHRLRVVDRKVVEEEVVLKGVGRIRDVKCSPEGELWIAFNTPDRIARIVPAEK